MDTVRRLFADKDEFVRAWTIQLTLDDDYERQSEENAKSLYAKDLNSEFARLAKKEKFPVVRLYLASALQRIPIDQRWDILTALVQHAEDAGDHNLPLMYWYAAEPAVGQDPAKAVALLKQSKIPIVREFIARRLATTSLNSMASK